MAIESLTKDEEKNPQRIINHFEDWRIKMVFRGKRIPTLIKLALIRIKCLHVCYDI